MQSPPNLVDDPVALCRRRGRRSRRDLAGHNRRGQPGAGLAGTRPPRGGTRRRGLRAVPRLAVHPEYVRAPERWLAPAMRAAVLEHADAEGLARDSAWCAGSDLAPPVVVATTGSVTGGSYRPAPSATCSPGSRPGTSRASPRSCRCSRPVAPRCAPSPRVPTSCAGGPSATPSRTSRTGTSTTRTSAPTGAASVLSARDGSRSTCAARRTC